MDQIISFQSYSACTCKWRGVCSCWYSLWGSPGVCSWHTPALSIHSPFDYTNGKPWVFPPLLCWWHTNLPFFPLFLLLLTSYKLDTIKFDWLSSNFLKLNHNKTEILLIGFLSLTKTLLSHTPLSHTPTLQLGLSTLPFKSSVKNLGVTFDNALSFKEHISKVCKTSFFSIT